jgi:hypothetical protein
VSALVISPDRDALPGSEPASSPGRLSLLASSLDRMMLLMDCDIMVLINRQYRVGSVLLQLVTFD